MKKTLYDFHVVGAGAEGANGKYSICSCGAKMRPEYYNSSDRSYRIRWSMDDGAWVLLNSLGGTLYVINGRDDQVFPHDAKWSLHEKRDLSVFTKVKDLKSFLAMLNLSDDARLRALSILKAEGVAVRQLFSEITDTELRDIGIDRAARAEIRRIVSASMTPPRTQAAGWGGGHNCAAAAKLAAGSPAVLRWFGCVALFAAALFAAVAAASAAAAVAAAAAATAAAARWAGRLGFAPACAPLGKERRPAGARLPRGRALVLSLAALAAAAVLIAAIRAAGPGHAPPELLRNLPGPDSEAGPAAGRSGGEAAAAAEEEGILRGPPSRAPAATSAADRAEGAPRRGRLPLPQSAAEGEV